MIYDEGYFMPGLWDSTLFIPLFIPLVPFISVRFKGLTLLAVLSVDV